MTILFFLLLTYVLLSISLFKVFEKAAIPPIKALIPGINFIEWCKLIGRPTWWAALLLVPIVNIFIYIGMCIDLIRSFKRYTFLDSLKVVLYAPLYFFQLGMNKKDKYDGPTLIKESVYQEKIQSAIQEKNSYKLKKLVDKNPYRKSAMRDWTEAIAFAVFAAAFIRMFTIEAYAIPTSSMEGSLNVGDHLFVSKLHYGLRTPSTVAMIPLLHNRIPYLNKESYLKQPNLSSVRLPAIEALDRNDPVVFNMPEGDSVYITPERTYSIYDVRRGNVPQELIKAIDDGSIDVVTRPIDKIDHYVKHCIGTPGETLQIIDRQVYANGKAVKNPKNLQYRYLIKHKNPLNTRNFGDWGITNEDQNYYRSTSKSHKLLILNTAQIAKLQAMDASIEIIPNDMYWVSFPTNFDKTQLADFGIEDSNVRSVNGNRWLLTLSKDQQTNLTTVSPTLSVERFDESDRLFPHDPQNFGAWNVDNYGPIWIPKAGEKLTITPENIALYRRIIDIYEDNNLTEKNGRIYINDEETTEYTFKQDYFWFMGDNRNNSEDSRMWGFVPETHIVGKPLFIFFSTRENDVSKGINWDRIFTSASKAE